jgi:hypothetical protein
VVLDVSGAGDAKLTDPKDLGIPTPPPLDVSFTATSLPSTVGSQHWLLTATVKGLTTTVTQKRFVSFNLGQQSVTLPYTLTNRPTQDFAWSVRGPTTEISLRPGQTVELGVSVGPVPATAVGLTQAIFIEQTSKTLVGNGWELCDALPDCNDHTFSISANSQKRLWLRPKGAADVVGKYSGTLVMGAAQKRDGESLTMSISGTSACRQWLGAGAILLGVVFAWVVSGYLQTRLNRAQVLLPATLLMEQVEETRSRLRACPPSLMDQQQQTAKALSDLADQLSPSALQAANLLPPRIPNPLVAWTPNADAYTKYLAAKTQKLAWLDLLVTQGFEKLWAKIPSAPTPEFLGAARTSAEALDALSTRDAPPQTDQQADISRIVQSFPPTTLAALARPAGPQQGQAGPALTYQLLNVEIARTSLWVWALFAVLATALGAYVIVLANTGFGLPGDYLLCFFWGVGVPIGAQQLTQSTAGTAASALGVTVPAARK